MELRNAKGKYGIGTIHSTLESGKIEIISGAIGTSYRTVKFINTGHERKCSVDSIRHGGIVDYTVSKGKYAIGTKHKTTKGGIIEVIEHVPSSHCRVVRFLNSGFITRVTTSSINSGLITDRSLSKGKYAIGTIHDTINCGKIEIIEHQTSHTGRTIRFLNTGHVKLTSTSAIHHGRISDNELIRKESVK